MSVQHTRSDAPVTLREITADTVRAVTRLSVGDDQQQFVAPNAVSLAQALFAPEAWYRAIYAGDELAGFVMLYDESLRPEAPDAPSIGVWRLMIDRNFQRRGIGQAAMLRVIEHVRAKARFTSLELSYVPGPGCPEPFYRGLGFRPTGRVDEGEIVLELPLNDAARGRREGAKPKASTMATRGAAPKTIDEYVAMFPHDVREILERIREIVARNAPGAQPAISYQIPAFMLDGPLVYFAAFKKHIGFYPPVRGDARLMKALAPYAGEKGNLRFPLDEPIPYVLIERIVKLRVEQNTQKSAGVGKSRGKPTGKTPARKTAKTSRKRDGANRG